MRSLTLSVAVLGALVAVPAAGADQWSAPMDVGAPGPYVADPRIAFTPGGEAFISWARRRQSSQRRGSPSCRRHTGYDGNRTTLATRTSNGPVISRRTLYGALVAPPVVFGDDRVAFLRDFQVTPDAECLFVVLGRTSGALTATRTLASGRIFSAPALAGNSRGDAVAAWVEWKPGPQTGTDFYDRFTLRIAVKRRGHGFGRPRTLLRSVGYSSDHGSNVAVAVGEHGEAVVLFAALHRRGGRDVHLLDAFVRRSAHGFGRRQVVGPYDNFAAIAPVITRRGRIVVAWGTQDGGEEANRPWVVRASSLARNGHSFSRVQVLDPGQGIERPSETMGIGVDRLGRATVAWSGVRGHFRRGWNWPVMVATSDRTGRFGKAVQIAPDGDVGNLVVRPDGSALLTWARTQGSYQITDQAFAALRGAGASAFGAAEPVAPPDVAHDPFGAFDPVSGTPVVFWSAHPGAEDPLSGRGAPSVLRFSTRR